MVIQVRNPGQVDDDSLVLPEHPRQVAVRRVRAAQACIRHPSSQSDIERVGNAQRVRATLRAATPRQHSDQTAGVDSESDLTTVRREQLAVASATEPDDLFRRRLAPAARRAFAATPEMREGQHRRIRSVRYRRQSQWMFRRRRNETLRPPTGADGQGYCNEM